MRSRCPALSQPRLRLVTFGCSALSLPPPAPLEGLQVARTLLVAPTADQGAVVAQRRPCDLRDRERGQGKRLRVSGEVRMLHNLNEGA